MLYELFCAACKPSCAKELEQLCACLALAAGALPPALAGGQGGAPQARCERGVTATAGAAGLGWLKARGGLLV